VRDKAMLKVPVTLFTTGKALATLAGGDYGVSEAGP
jgi:hypothetical protein